MTTNEIEAANRAEVTAILIRTGNRVYRPEADVSGEDLVIRRLGNDALLLVQMKSRPMVHSFLYGGRNIWMLFPDPVGDIPGRPWFLIKHDELFEWFKGQHGALSGWEKRSKANLAEWSEKRISNKLGEFLYQFKLPLPSRSTKGKQRP
ncbi:MAG TPA: hypothetical protein VND90_04445 [Terracidiphilus sp.]|nr:hypothetical protein [Terracidiphilus sp.]